MNQRKRRSAKSQSSSRNPSGRWPPSARSPSPPRPAPRPEVPSRTGKALGFRSWKLDGYKLLSANKQFGGWNIGEPTEARCIHWAHRAPDPDCECGLYALYSPEFASRWHGKETKMVHGAVLGWGRLQVHWEGWRAEYAQPAMLAIDGDRQTYNHCQRVKALGAELGLPVVEWPEYEAAARRLALPVPEELRPERTQPHIPSGVYAPAPAWSRPPLPHWTVYGSNANLRWYACSQCGMTFSYCGFTVPIACPSCGR